MHVALVTTVWSTPPPLQLTAYQTAFGPRRGRAVSLLAVLRYAPELCLGGEDIASRVDGNTLAHCTVRRVRHHVRRNEDRHSAVFETSDPDASLPSWMNRFGRL